jgi:polar amino acid transport system substrate-binding protein
MKYRMFVLMLGVLSLFLAVDASAGPALDRILEKKELVVGTSGEQPPLSVNTKDGETIGLDADLARGMAKEMGVKLTLKVMPFSKLLPALKNGQVDMILSGMTMTPNRNLGVIFVGPYYISGKGLLAKQKTVVAIEDHTEINSPEFTIAALAGSTSELFAKESLPKAKLVTTKSLEKALELLFSDSVDGLVADYPYCAVSAFRYMDKGLMAGKVRFTTEPIGVGLPTNDLLLVNWVENYIKTLELTGDLRRLTKRWFENADWIGKLPASGS